MYLLILLSLIAADPIPQNIKEMILNNVCRVEGEYYNLAAVLDLEEAWLKWKDAPSMELVQSLKPLDTRVSGSMDEQQKQIVEKALAIQVLRFRRFEGVEDPLELFRQYLEYVHLNRDAFRATDPGSYHNFSISYHMASEALLELEYGIMGDSPDYAGLLSKAEGHVMNRNEDGWKEAIVVQRLLLRQDPGFLEYVDKALAEREETDSEPRIWQIIREERTDRKLQDNRGQMLDRLPLLRERKAAGLSIVFLPLVGP